MALSLIEGTDVRKLKQRNEKLKKLHMIEDQNMELMELERTKRQKEILDDLSSVSWW